MTLQYPDVSNFQGNMALQAGTPACFAKATEGTGYADPYYAHYKAEAARVGALFGGYHFLHAGNGAGQAQFCFQHVGAGIPVMIDQEPTGSSNPTVQDSLDFAAEFRTLGGICVLNYLPRWYWVSLGSPSLLPLASAGLALVSSSYPSGGYSDTGPGWQAYGGVAPVIWQYTDAQSYSGQPVDFNAFRGTVAELEALLLGDTMQWTDKIDGIDERPNGNQVNYILTDVGRLRDFLTGDATAAKAYGPSSPLGAMVAAAHTVPQLASELTALGTAVSTLETKVAGISTPTIDPAALSASVQAALTNPATLKAIAHALAVELHNDTPSS